MCAICGVLQRDPAQPADAARLRRMTAVLAHRGPDAEGVHVDGPLGLGHRRLSIIDLSDAGRQPMATPDKRWWIVLNGEIYNYRELRADLEARGHVFRSETDTEVLLRWFAEEGPASLQRLIGMFAFAVWDAHERRLFAARDHFGVKPFYYTATPREFAFASEIKALVGPSGLPAEPDPAGLADYVTFQFTLDDRTLFRGVRKLPPGHYLVVEPGGDPVVRRYWDVDFEVDTDHTEAYFQDRLRELLEDAVRLQLRADVPVGAHLSGGLDSTTVTCLAAARSSGPFHTFSGGFPDEGPAFDESRYARLAAEAAGTVHHEVRPTPDDFVALMPKLAYLMDEPAAGPGLFPQFAVSDLAARHVKVVLGGQGGDEIFGGYARYLVAYLEACIRGGIEGTQEDHRYIVTFESILPNLVQLRGYEPMMRQFWAEGLFESADRRYFRLIDRSAEMDGALDAGWRDAARPYSPFEAFRAIFEAPACRSLINKMTHVDLKTLLPALLHVEDRTSMAVSIESRVPLLDHRIVALVASMPPMIKFKGGRSKHVFREVVAPIVPPAIYDRRDKMGFPVPLSRWYRREPVRGFVRDVLLGRAARERGWVRPAAVEAMLEGERDYGRGLWGLLNLELWAQTFLDGHGGR